MAQVIVAPFLQRRRLLAESAVGLGQNIIGTGQDVSRSLFAYQQMAEREKQDEIQHLENIAKMSGGWSSAGDGFATQYENLTGMKLPRDADGNLIKTPTEKVLAQIPPTQENAMIQAGIMRPRQAPSDVQARYDIINLQNDMKLRMEGQREDEAYKRAMLRLQGVREGIESREYTAEQNRAQRERLAGKTAEGDLSKPSGFGLYKGKIFPWAKVADKPGAQDLTLRAYQIFSGQQNNLRKMDDYEERTKLIRGMDELRSDLLKSDNLRKTMAFAFTRDKDGNYVYQNNKRAHAIVTGALTTALTKAGMSPDRASAIIAGVGPKSTAEQAIANEVGQALNDSRSADDGPPVDEKGIPNPGPMQAAPPPAPRAGAKTHIIDGVPVIQEQ